MACLKRERAQEQVHLGISISGTSRTQRTETAQTASASCKPHTYHQWQLIVSDIFNSSRPAASRMCTKSRITTFDTRNITPITQAVSASPKIPTPPVPPRRPAPQSNHPPPPPTRVLHLHRTLALEPVPPPLLVQPTSTATPPPPPPLTTFAAPPLPPTADALTARLLQSRPFSLLFNLAAAISWLQSKGMLFIH